MKLKKSESLFHHILLFTIAQFAWCLLLGLWIFWYITNTDRSGKLSSPQTPESIALLVSGIVLLVTLSTILSLIFAYLARQMNITSLYDSFISNITHELKSPLSSIQLFLETMKKRQLDREKQELFIENMLTDVHRLDKLINSVLNLSTIGYIKAAGKLVHDYHVYDADSIIRDVITEVKKSLRLEDKQIAIEGKLSCRCVVDKKWLLIVFNNLIDNALKYNAGNACISVKLGISGRYFTVSVKDNGTGIDKKNQKKIFRKFYRIENQDSPNVRGTGIGLYWVKKIIGYHGGRISVFSSGKNMGTTFVIYLPVFEKFNSRDINRLLRLSSRVKEEVEK